MKMPVVSISRLHGWQQLQERISVGNYDVSASYEEEQLATW